MCPENYQNITTKERKTSDLVQIIALVVNQVKKSPRDSPVWGKAKNLPNGGKNLCNTLLSNLTLIHG